jgi:hypothetical protein
VTCESGANIRIAMLQNAGKIHGGAYAGAVGSCRTIVSAILPSLPLLAHELFAALRNSSLDGKQSIKSVVNHSCSSQLS